MLLLTTAACDDAFIDPFSNDDRFFTIYGYLDEGKNFEAGAEHTVRVIPVTRFAERIASPTDDQASIDARVISTDLRTGEVQRWTHSLEQLSDGTYAHIFRAQFFIRPARTYRLEVHRSDGVVAAAETTLPNPGGIEALLGAAQVEPDAGAVVQEVVLTRVPSPWAIEVVYHMGDSVCFFSAPQTRAYGRAGSPTDDGGWRFTINLTDDLDQLPGGNTLCAMGLRVRLLDSQWTPPEGVFDSEVLAQPGTLSNVENGYGFWGSVGLYQHDWQVNDALRDLLGF